MFMRNKPVQFEVSVCHYIEAEWEKKALRGGRNPERRES
jgi:hypothetical protein